MQKLRRGFLENPRGNENTCKRLTPHFWFVFRCSADLQNDFCRNVVLSGGTTLTRGLVSRLEHELTRINPKIRSVRAPANRGYSAWIGGSILGSLSSLDNMYATVDEYAEHGARIINQKCFWRSLWFSYEIVKFSLWLLFIFCYPFFFRIWFFFLEKCLDGYHIIKTFAGSFTVKKSSSETFGTARGIGEEIEFVGSDFGPWHLRSLLTDCPGVSEEGSVTANGHKGVGWNGLFPMNRKQRIFQSRHVEICLLIKSCQCEHFFWKNSKNSRKWTNNRLIS